MSEIKVLGIIATINNTLFALTQNDESFIPHGNKGLTLMDNPKTIKLKDRVQEFSLFDKKYFWDYVRNIEDNSVILIGKNTFDDAFFLFNKLISDKAITFIVSDSRNVNVIVAKENAWPEKKIVMTHSFTSKDKKENLETAKNIAIEKTRQMNDGDSIPLLYVMGGKSLYETMFEEYDEFINVNIKIKQSQFNEFMKRNKGVSYVLTDVVDKMIKNNFFSKEILEKHEDISVLSFTNNQRKNSV